VTADRMFFFFAGISVGVDLALLLHLILQWRDARAARKAARA
jgi:hypothetical protein